MICPTSHSPKITLMLDDSAKPWIRFSVRLIGCNVAVNERHWVISKASEEEDLFSLRPHCASHCSAANCIGVNITDASYLTLPASLELMLFTLPVNPTYSVWVTFSSLLATISGGCSERTISLDWSTCQWANASWGSIRNATVCTSSSQVPLQWDYLEDKF